MPLVGQQLARGSRIIIAAAAVVVIITALLPRLVPAASVVMLLMLLLLLLVVVVETLQGVLVSAVIENRKDIDNFFFHRLCQGYYFKSVFLTLQSRLPGKIVSAFLKVLILPRGFNFRALELNRFDDPLYLSS